MKSLTLFLIAVVGMLVCVGGYYYIKEKKVNLNKESIPVNVRIRNHSQIDTNKSLSQNEEGHHHSIVK